MILVVLAVAVTWALVACLVGTVVGRALAARGSDPVIGADEPLPGAPGLGEVLVPQPRHSNRG